MMNTYRQDGGARVYWLTLPLPRDARPPEDRARRSTPRSSRPPQPYRAQVRVLDMTAVFTPGGRYRASMDVDGRDDDRARGRRHPPQRGRRRLAADVVVGRLKSDFESLR